MSQDNLGSPLVDTESHLFSFLLMKPVACDFMGLMILIIKGYLSFKWVQFYDGAHSQEWKLPADLIHHDNFNLSWGEAYILV